MNSKVISDFACKSHKSMVIPEPRTLLTGTPDLDSHTALDLAVTWRDYVS